MSAAENTVIKSGDKAPYFKIKYLDRNDYVFFRDLQKVKNEGGLIIYDFFATWCTPCKNEFPIFEKIYSDLAAKKILFYAISIDAKHQDVWKFIKDDTKVTFPVLWDQNAFGAAKKYGADSVLPQLFIIDKEGIVRIIHVGEIKNLEAVLKSEIESLIPGTFPDYKNIKAEIGESAKKQSE